MKSYILKTGWFLIFLIALSYYSSLFTEFTIFLRVQPLIAATIPPLALMLAKNGKKAFNFKLPNTNKSWQYSINLNISLFMLITIFQVLSNLTEDEIIGQSLAMGVLVTLYSVIGKSFFFLLQISTKNKLT
jgi:hypothetical protein